MKKNMGTIDRAVRVLLAVLFIALYAAGVTTGTVGLVLVALAVIFLLTSFVSFCPLYLPFGLSTLRKKSASKN